jgi:hypothetical protein
MLRNSIHQHGHKIRHVKEIPYISMESNIDTISYNKTTSAWVFVMNYPNLSTRKVDKKKTKKHLSLFLQKIFLCAFVL